MICSCSLLWQFQQDKGDSTTRILQASIDFRGQSRGCYQCYKYDISILDSRASLLGANLKTLLLSSQESMSRDCPLLQTRLPWTLRLLFFSGTFSYLTAAFCTPLFIVVPYVAVAFKIFPVLLDPDFVYFFVPYFCLMHAGIPFPQSCADLADLRQHEDADICFQALSRLACRMGSLH